MNIVFNLSFCLLFVGCSGLDTHEKSTPLSTLKTVTARVSDDVPSLNKLGIKIAGPGNVVLRSSRETNGVLSVLLDNGTILCKEHSQERHIDVGVAYIIIPPNASAWINSERAAALSGVLKVKIVENRWEQLEARESLHYRSGRRFPVQIYH